MLQLAFKTGNTPDYRFYQLVVASDNILPFWDGDDPSYFRQQYLSDDDEKDLLNTQTRIDSHNKKYINPFYGQHYNGAFEDGPHRGKLSNGFSWRAMLFIYKNDILDLIITYGFYYQNGQLIAYPITGSRP
jgi:hypothetical protein